MLIMLLVGQEGALGATQAIGGVFSAGLAALPKEERPSKVIVVIMTDGLENASRVFSKDKVLSMITEQRDIYKWDFVYLGANQDAIATAAAMGIDAASSITYKPDSAAAANVVSAMSAAVRRSRESGQSVSYTPGERKASLFEDDNDKVKNQRP